MAEDPDLSECYAELVYQLADNEPVKIAAAIDALIDIKLSLLLEDLADRTESAFKGETNA